jgi:hypothetical protein
VIHPYDEETLTRILGVDRIPEEIEAEYAIRISMYHRGGGSGPLGVIGLIDLSRSLGYAPPKTDAKPDQFVWRDYPQDGTVRVEALYFGAWQPGIFLGFVEAGTLAVRLDGDDFVRECRPDMVRMVGIKEVIPPIEEPDARASLLKPAEKPVEEPEPLPLPPSEPDPLLQDEDPPEFNWSTVTEGEPVWVETDGDYKDASFVTGEDSEEGVFITVLIKGEKKPRRVPVSCCTYAGSGPTQTLED